jgi:hypothetical protein
VEKENSVQEPLSSFVSERRRKMVKFELPLPTNGRPLQTASSSAASNCYQPEQLLHFFPALQQQLMPNRYFLRTCMDIEREMCSNNLGASNGIQCNALIALLHKHGLIHENLRQNQLTLSRPANSILKTVNGEATAIKRDRNKPRFIMKYKCMSARDE